VAHLGRGSSNLPGRTGKAPQTAAFAFPAMPSLRPDSNVWLANATSGTYGGATPAMTGPRCRPTSTASSVRACATTPPLSPCAARLAPAPSPRVSRLPPTRRDGAGTPPVCRDPLPRLVRLCPGAGKVSAGRPRPPAFLGLGQGGVGGAAPVRRLGHGARVARPRKTRSTFCSHSAQKVGHVAPRGPLHSVRHAEGAECVDSIERDRAGSGWRLDHGRGSSPEGAAAGAAAVSISWSCSSGNPSGSTRSIASAPASSQRRTTSGASS
jgi:hypothetical protein